MDPVHRLIIPVSPSVVDQNRHVNNVAYVQWMQDVAIEHSTAVGCTRLTEEIGATWFARMHRIEYLTPAFAGDVIEAQTWVADFRKVRTLRRYRFVRPSDGKVLAEGETDWVLVDVKTGRPRSIPAELAHLFTLVPDSEPAVRRDK